ncbi:Cof-type HAD-IIB family hydrolase [Pseudomonas lactis]|uniref:Cof-like hydrolase family protein n=1 Tax=Pseudomonas lactis TaxID=1615674 RepID=I4KGI3_9PSED|nr:MULTISPECIES: Cof-type HAD-IIB family hydrolase [Pseudomonas]MBD8558040.1 Cof-type HAD-IIB family hydrolase [Pseudomonas fluorescens]EIK63823.1 Cof-like hydrolase family protein [Pseudomonas lactis]MBR7213729.1 Cof-type HAD-IIB family hydrolase [Pseudomonas sp. B2021]MDR8371391.1 Cof-type HAD-IIB family hydrolase [Pseudomonas lactis]NNA49309.1 Cof-type HAD-IIB family hydrolase [Pseudomonas lactis]
MSDATIHPIRFVLSDVDGTLLHPDHSLSQRTADAIRAMREAGVLFSLASGRPPKAMRHLIETFGIDVPVAGFNGGTLVNPDGSILVAHHLPAEAALITLALFSAESDVEVWVFADGDWLRRDPPGPMVQREADGLGYGPVVVESFEPYLDRVDKIVAASNNTQLLVELEAQLQPKVQGLAQVSRSQPVYLDVTAMLANKGEALKTLAEHLGVPLAQTAAIGDGGNDPAMFHVAGLSIAMGQAEETVKRQANVVTGSNVEDGAAEAFERFILTAR